MDGNWLEAYVSNVWNAPAFVFCNVMVGFNQIKLAGELANHMPWTDVMCLEIWPLASDRVMVELLDGFGKWSGHNNNIYIRSEQSLTQNLVVSFKSIVVCGNWKLKCLHVCDMVC